MSLIFTEQGTHIRIRTLSQQVLLINRAPERLCSLFTKMTLQRIQNEDDNAHQRRKKQRYLQYQHLTRTTNIT